MSLPFGQQQNPFPVRPYFHEGIDLANDLKAKLNAHEAATFANSAAGLLAATATVAAPVTVLAAAMISNTSPPSWTIAICPNEIGALARSTFAPRTPVA